MPKFVSDILARANLMVDGMVYFNNTATGQTPNANDNSTKLATTAWVRTFVQPYSLPIASASVLGGVKVGSGLSIDSVTGVLTAGGGSGNLNFRTIQEFTATAGQTTFTIAGGYNVGYLEVFINGVYISESQYTATNGSTIVLNDPVSHNDIVTVFLFSLYNLGESNYVRNIDTLTATAGQTTFSTSYIPGQIDVYYNGSKLNAAEFTATNGSSIILAQAAVLGDIIEVVTYLAGAGLNANRTLTINGTTYDLTANRTWTLTTANISEVTNLYYTDARVATYLTTNSYATQSYVSTQLANLVASAPSTLDTLNELATALGNDPNFATTIATSIGTKQAQLNGTGFVKISGTTISYDNSTYLTTGSAASIYQTILTNPVTGTGTTNYLPKFTGTSTIGNSLLIDQGSYVESTANMLISNASTYRGLSITTTTASARPTLSFVNSNYAQYGSYIQDINGRLAFGRMNYDFGGHSEAMTLNASGNLSIGNTNDTYKLDVSGASRILASTYTSGAILYLRDAAATGSNTTFGGLFLGSSPGTDFVLGKQSTNTVGSFAIKTGGGTSLFTLTDSGAATFSSSVTATSLNISGGTDYNTVFTSTSNRSGWVINTPGTTSPGGSALVLASDGSYRLGNASQYQIVMYTTNEVGIWSAGAERVKVTTIGPTTMGCLLVNKTTASSSYPIQTQSTNGAYMASANGPGDANYYSTSPTIGYHIYGDQGGAAKFNVTGPGRGYFAAGVLFGSGSSTLNYYQEGTWAPQLYAGSSAFTMSGINEGKYVRIGNQVTITGHLQWSGGSGSGMVKIAGLPFVCTGVRSAGSMGAVSYGISFNSGYNHWILVVDPGTDFIYIIQGDSSGGGYSHTPPVGSSGVIYGFSITYHIL